MFAINLQPRNLVVTAAAATNAVGQAPSPGDPRRRWALAGGMERHGPDSSPKTGHGTIQTCPKLPKHCRTAYSSASTGQSPCNAIGRLWIASRRGSTLVHPAGDVTSPAGHCARTLTRRSRKGGALLGTAALKKAILFSETNLHEAAGSKQIGPEKGTNVISAARQTGPDSGLGAVTNGALLCVALSHPRPPRHANQEANTGRRAETALSRHVDRGLPTTPSSPTSPPAKQQLLNNKPFRHPDHVPDTCGPCCVEDLHELGHPSRCTHLSCAVEGAIRPPAHAGDPTQIGIVSANEGLQLLPRDAVGLRQSVEKRWDGLDAAQHGPRAHLAWAWAYTQTRACHSTAAVVVWLRPGAAYQATPVDHFSYWRMYSSSACISNRRPGESGSRHWLTSWPGSGIAGEDPSNPPTLQGCDPEVQTFSHNGPGVETYTRMRRRGVSECAAPKRPPPQPAAKRLLRRRVARAALGSTRVRTRARRSRPRRRPRRASDRTPTLQMPR
eukprot:366560-Chlamydomonas_euryale.AAC.9